MQPAEAVCPHDPDEAGAVEQRPEAEQSCRREAGTEPLLEVGDKHARMAGNDARQRQPLGEVFGLVRVLQGVLGRDNPPDAVEICGTNGLQAGGAMAFVGRIEGAAEQADAMTCRKRGERARTEMKEASGTHSFAVMAGLDPAILF